MKNLEKILIIGADGLIGRACSQEIGKGHNWIGTSYPEKELQGFTSLDITSSCEIERVFKRVKPTCVVHCANLAGGLDYCEKRPDLAKKFHFEGTVNIGRQCLEYKSKLVFISSECVFDGKRELYKEEDDVNPLNVYGKWKAESEKWIRQNLKDYIIARTMSVYGWDPKTVTPNAIMKVYFSILKKEEISISAFRRGNPTYVKDLAKAIAELALAESRGIFHIAGRSFVGRYEWLKKACDVLGWDASFLIPRKEPLTNNILRPLRVNFNTDKFQSEFTVKLHNLEESLNLLKQDVSENE